MSQVSSNNINSSSDAPIARKLLLLKEVTDFEADLSKLNDDELSTIAVLANMKEQALEIALGMQSKTHSQSVAIKAAVNQVIEQDIDSEKAGRKGRGVLPREVSNALKHWLMENLSNPYPTEQEKHQMCQQFKMTLTQINNWFINARRRYIRQKMIETGASTANPMIPQQIQIPKYQVPNVQTVFTPQSQPITPSILLSAADKELTPPIQDFGSRRISELSAAPLTSAAPFETVFTAPSRRRRSSEQSKGRDRHFSFSKYPNLDDELGILLSSDYTSN